MTAADEAAQAVTDIANALGDVLLLQHAKAPYEQQHAMQIKLFEEINRHGAGQKKDWLDRKQNQRAFFIYLRGTK